MTFNFGRRSHARHSVSAFAALAVLATSFAHAASPTISGSPATSTLVGKVYSFTPTARDTDGQRLTFSIASKPSWAGFSSTTGKLTGTPTKNDTRAWSNIVITVTDGSNRRSLPKFAILVRPAAGGSSSGSNAAPKIAGSPAKSVTAGNAYAFQPSASDSNKDKLTFSVTNKPSWATFSTSTGKLAGTPWDHHVGTTSNIVIKVSDGKSTSALPAFALTVKGTSGAGATDGAVTVSWNPPTRTEGGSSLTNLAGYRVRYGRSATSLTQMKQISNPGVARHLLEDLSAGTWFVAISAYTSQGVESELSEIVRATIR